MCDPWALGPRELRPECRGLACQACAGRREDCGTLDHCDASGGHVALHMIVWWADGSAAAMARTSRSKPRSSSESASSSTRLVHLSRLDARHGAGASGKGRGARGYACTCSDLGPGSGLGLGQGRGSRWGVGRVPVLSRRRACAPPRAGARLYWRAAVPTMAILTMATIHIVWEGAPPQAGARQPVVGLMCSVPA